MKFRRFRPRLLQFTSVAATDVDARGRGCPVDADVPWTWTSRGRRRPEDANAPWTLARQRERTRLGQGRFGNLDARGCNRIDHTALHCAGCPLRAMARTLDRRRLLRRAGPPRLGSVF